jgi:hypothetical protein
LCKRRIELYRFLWTDTLFSSHSRLEKCRLILPTFSIRVSCRSLGLKWIAFFLSAVCTQSSGLPIDLAYTKQRSFLQLLLPVLCWRQIRGITHVRQNTRCYLMTARPNDCRPSAKWWRLGRAIAQAVCRRVFVGFPQRRPGF